MSRETIVARGRAAAEAGMRDTCTVRRHTGTTVDDETGYTTPTWSDLYAGPCRLKQPNAAASSATVGEAEVLLQQPELHLPMSAVLLQPADEVTMTGSQFDPVSVGRVLLIRDVPAHSGATARRYGVTERTG